MAAAVLGRPYVGRAARGVEFRLGPWVGVRDDLSPNATTPGHLSRLTNGYLDNLSTGASVVGRPGFAALGDQLGSLGARTVQCVAEFLELDGTRHTVAIVGGQFYTYDWGGSAWVETLDATDLSGAGVTLSPTARVYAVTFANQLVLSDGVNTPWAWDGTAGGGITLLDNCPVLFGQPVVYYAKLFGIKAAERSTIVWSEEGDPNEGYEALIGGRQYNNAWTIGQTDQDALFALAATNRALYLFRARSITEVVGAVSDDFRTTGTRDAISGSVGCMAPDGIEVVDEGVWFWGSDNAPYVIQAGGGLREAGTGMVVASSRLPTTVAAHGTIVAAYLDYCRGVLFGVPEAGQSQPTVYHLVSTENGEWIGTWTGWACTALGVVTDDAELPRLVHGGGAGPTTAADGWVYLHGRPTLALWRDEFASGPRTIAHELVTGYLLFDPAREHHLERVDVSVVPVQDLTTCRLAVTTPAGTATSAPFTITGVGGAFWNQFTWNQATWAGVAVERTWPVGTASEGRWVQVGFAHAGAGEPWQVNQLRLVALVRDDRPGVR